LSDPIAATSLAAIARAGVGFDIITIVAGLFGIDSTVAADLAAANDRAAILVLKIAIVAFLKTIFFGLQVGAQNTVAAKSEFTG
jgi:hypothetical protein